MVFTETDRHTVRVITTVVHYTNEPSDYLDSIIFLGQHLGVPKDETLGIVEESDVFDILDLESEKAKKKFIKRTFEEVLHIKNDSIHALYSHIQEELGMTA